MKTQYGSISVIELKKHEFDNVPVERLFGNLRLKGTNTMHMTFMDPHQKFEFLKNQI